MIISLAYLNPSYAIVRNHQIEDQFYLDLGKKYDSVVMIETETSFGSGVVLNQSTIITSAHNVKFKKNVKIVYDYKEIIPYNIIYHKNKDIAILKFKDEIKTQNLEMYHQEYNNEIFDIVGYGCTGTGLTGAAVRDFKKRAGRVRCSDFKNEFYECEFKDYDDIEGEACAAGGDSGGGVFKDNKLAGIITYVTSNGTDSRGDSDYGDYTAFIPIKDIEGWIVENL